MAVIRIKPVCKIIARSELDPLVRTKDPEVKPGEITFFHKPIINAILDNLKAGMSLKDAAQLVDVDPKEVVKWKESNRGNFGNMVLKAESEYKKLLMLKMLRGKGDWKPASFMLERKYRSEFGKDAIDENSRGVEQVMVIGGKEIRFT
jgi:hypothetical protein